MHGKVLCSLVDVLLHLNFMGVLQLRVQDSDNTVINSTPTTYASVPH